MPTKNKPQKSYTVCLVDGEHYLANLQESLATIAEIYNVRYLIFIGGTEKIGTPADVKKALPYPVFFANKEQGPDCRKLEEILRKHPVELVLDLSDEPIMDYLTRFEVACRILHQGIVYRGSDFEFRPLQFKKILTKPSLAIWGTGKRIGKTALGGMVGRVLKQCGLKPAIITLSRGGPTKPIIVRGDQIKIDMDYLLNIDAQGMHASSDCFEDALTARVATFGCRRCGGGFAGKAMVTVLERGARMAEKAPYVQSVILEGSGATIPEIKTDKVILVMDMTQPEAILQGYMTPLRILYADLIILTMCENFLTDQKKINRVIQRIRQINAAIPIATTVLRPFPLEPIRGKKVFLACTAPQEALPFLKKYLEKTYGCRVEGISNHLSVRPILLRELRGLKNTDLMLTELKAAAIAVAAKEAKKKGLNTVLMDNHMVVVKKGGNVPDLKKTIAQLLKK
ncbi:2,3-diphosphoglycerate synthetase [Candidatus Peregrinibacteria bacterium]|nr:2,3-diphosphoglycerate synthetase [Candidatus Peregrinibacteria bacterium]